MKGKEFSGLGIFIGSILVGEWLHAKIPGEIIEKVAATGFVIIGILM